MKHEKFPDELYPIPETWGNPPDVPSLYSWDDLVKMIDGLRDADLDVDENDIGEPYGYLVDVVNGTGVYEKIDFHGGQKHYSYFSVEPEWDYDMWGYNIIDDATDRLDLDVYDEEMA